MPNNKELINFNDPKNIIEFLQSPAVKMAEFITGLLVSESKDYKLSAGRLVQASIKWKLFSQLGQEIKDYVSKGKIKEDYIEEDLGKQTLSEMLKFIDEAAPDEVRFNAMKSLFMKSVIQESSDEDKALSYQFMKICKELESGHIMVLKAAYEICKEGGTNPAFAKDTPNGKVEVNPNDGIAENWLRNISLLIGHGIPALIEVYEEKLIALKLISPRRGSDSSGITFRNYRLTTLGLKISDFLSNQI